MKRNLPLILFAFLIMVSVALFGCEESNEAKKNTYETFPHYVENLDETVGTGDIYSEPVTLDTGENEPTESIEAPTDKEPEKSEPIEDETTESVTTETEPTEPVETDKRTGLDKFIYSIQAVENIINKILTGAFPNYDSINDEGAQPYEGTAEINIESLNLLGKDYLNGNKTSFNAVIKTDGKNNEICGTLNAENENAVVNIYSDEKGNTYIQLPDVEKDVFIKIFSESKISEILKALKLIENIADGKNNIEILDGNDFINQIISNIDSYISGKIVAEEKVDITIFGKTISDVDKVTMTIGGKKSGSSLLDKLENLFNPNKFKPEYRVSFYLKNETVYRMECFFDTEEGTIDVTLDLSFDGYKIEYTGNIDILTKENEAEGISQSEAAYEFNGEHTETTSSASSVSGTLEVLIVKDEDTTLSDRLYDKIGIALGYTSIFPDENTINTKYEVGISLHSGTIQTKFTLPVDVLTVKTGNTTEITVSMKSKMLKILDIDIEMKIIKEFKSDIQVNMPTINSENIIDRSNENDREKLDSYYAKIKLIYPKIYNIMASVLSRLIEYKELIK